MLEKSGLVWFQIVYECKAKLKLNLQVASYSSIQIYQFFGVGSLTVMSKLINIFYSVYQYILYTLFLFPSMIFYKCNKLNIR